MVTVNVQKLAELLNDAGCVSTFGTQMGLKCF